LGLGENELEKAGRFTVVRVGICLTVDRGTGFFVGLGVVLVNLDNLDF